MKNLGSQVPNASAERTASSRLGAGRIKLLFGAASIGLIGGFGVGLKALDATRSLDLARNRQWFALADLVSPSLHTWVSIGLASGLGAAAVLAFFGRYDFVKGRVRRVLWSLLLSVAWAYRS